MRVVSNTSPLSNLAIIGRLDLLKWRYGAVGIPPAVAGELFALTHPAAKAHLAAALAQGWLVVENSPLPPPPLPFPLDAGETEAIALALAVKADVLLMDEKRGRELHLTRSFMSSLPLSRPVFLPRSHRSGNPSLESSLGSFVTQGRKGAKTPRREEMRESILLCVLASLRPCVSFFG